MQRKFIAIILAVLAVLVGVLLLALFLWAQLMKTPPPAPGFNGPIGAPHVVGPPGPPPPQ